MNLEVGKVVHYDAHNRKAVLLLNHLLKIGDKIHIQGILTECLQVVEAIQANNQSVYWAWPGEQVVVSVKALVREDDRVYRVAEMMLTSPNVTL